MAEKTTTASSQDASVPADRAAPVPAAAPAAAATKAVPAETSSSKNGTAKKKDTGAAASGAPTPAGGGASHGQGQQQHKHHRRRGGHKGHGHHGHVHHHGHGHATTTTPSTTSLVHNDPTATAATLTAHHRTALLRSLTTQLEYYFSGTNLTTDTYLRTLMDLNDGFVPINVVSNFAAVNRIVAQNDPDGSVLAGETGEGRPGGTSTSMGGVPSLVREAALRSDALDVAVLDAEGKVIEICGAEDGGGDDVGGDKKKKGEGGEDRAAAEAAASGGAGGGAVSAGGEGGKKGGKTTTTTTIATAKVSGGGLTLVAVGPKGGELPPGIVQGAGAKGNKSGGSAFQHRQQHPASPIPAQHNAAATVAAGPSPIVTPQKANQMTSVEPERNTIILRDTPPETTEDDIRSTFASLAESSTTNCPPVHSVRPDVGNTWFVTLEPLSSRDDLVSILLDLRGRTVRGEPVRARLKTESVSARSHATTTAGAQQAYPYSSYSAPQSPVAAATFGGVGGGVGGGGPNRAAAATNRPYLHQQHQQPQQPGGEGGRKAHPQRGGGGAGGPPSLRQKQGADGRFPSSSTRQSRSVPSSPMAGERRVVATGAAGGARGGRMGVPSPHPPGKGRGFGIGEGGRGADGEKGGGGGGGGGDRPNKPGARAPAPAPAPAPPRAAIPPPPLVDLHFPSLSGDVPAAAPDKKREPPSASSPSDERPEQQQPPSRYKAAIVDGDGKGGSCGGPSPPTKSAAAAAAQHPRPAAPTASGTKTTGGSAATPKRTSESSVEAKKPVGGYAAALLKAPKATPPSSEPSSGRSSPASISKKKKELKLPPSTGSKGPSSKNSVTATSITDESSSADDKSSVSSHTESIGSTPLAVSAPAWGGGKTFADILKKKQESSEA